MSVNGSSATGHCPKSYYQWRDPTSSVLQDGRVPTLTRLDGDYWASQLFTLHTTTRLATDITFDFRRTPDFTRVEIIEVVMLNCPEWGMEIQNIRLL